MFKNYWENWKIIGRSLYLSFSALSHFDYIFDTGIDVSFATLLVTARMALYPSLAVRVLLRASVSGVELQLRCRKARCNYQDVAMDDRLRRGPDWNINHVYEFRNFRMLVMLYRSRGKKITPT